MTPHPENLKYTQTHEWLLLNDHEATIGITHHAQDLLGDMVFVELPELGKHFSAGEEMGVVESVKAASDFYAPISGEVIAINHEAINDPGIVNQSPYENGWLVKIRIKNKNEAQELMNADEYQALLEKGH